MPDGEQHSDAVRTAAASKPGAAGDGRRSFAGTRRARGTILIVDDKECVRRLAQRQAEGLGFSTLVVASVLCKPYALDVLESKLAEVLSED